MRENAGKEKNMKAQTKNSRTDMTRGSIVSLIVSFALPLLLSNLFQQFYNIADITIVGHTLGDNALSAVGSVSVIYSLITSLCFGLTNGFAILVSQFYGAGDEKNMKKSIAGTVELSIAGALVMTLAGYFTLKPFMRILHTPEEIFDQAYTYIVIIVLGVTATTFYNMLASILRALGNSIIPLVFLIISSLLNIGLDLFCILVLHQGLAGAAGATVAAQLISGVLCFIYIRKNVPAMRLSLEDFRLSGKLVSSLLSSGFAMALMYAVVNLGTVVLQSGINGLGAETIAAHVSARKISEIYMMPSSALASTMATFAGQNYGAGKMDRVWKGFKFTNALGFIWAALVIAVSYLFSGAIMAALTGSSDSAIIGTGSLYLKINSPFYFALMPLCIGRSTLQGIGSKVWPVVSSSLEMLGKILVVIFFIPRFRYLAVCFCEPATWIVCCILVCTVLLSRKDIRAAWHKKSERREPEIGELARMIYGIRGKKSAVR